MTGSLQRMILDELAQLFADTLGRFELDHVGDARDLDGPALRHGGDQVSRRGATPRLIQGPDHDEDRDGQFPKPIRRPRIERLRQTLLVLRLVRREHILP